MSIYPFLQIYNLPYMQVNAVQSMKVKQSQLQPLLLSPIACGLIQHTKRGRKRSLCKACFTYRHQMWQQCRRRRRGEADAASGGTCCLWQLWDAFQPPRGPSWDISKATLETVTVTKGCPRVLRVCVRVCACVLGLCFCLVPSDMSSLAICLLHLTLVILSRIWFDNNAFQNVPRLCPRKKLIWLSAQWGEGRAERVVKRRTHIYEAHKNYWHIQSHKYLPIRMSG